MNNLHDEKWHRLLACSEPTFQAEVTPPYGFITAAMGKLRSEQRQQQEIERIGWRALLASLAALIIAATVTFSTYQDPSSDFEPGVKGLVQMENIPVS
jgi:hypothetical protein